MLVAALGHDLGHDGVNTGFHVNSSSDLAMRYNDRSPLENMHAYELFDAMRQTGCNIFEELEGAEKTKARTVVIDAIIGTDMAFHKKHVDDMAGKADLDMEDTHDREELIAQLVHLCDIGASTYMWDESTRWSRMVMTEMQTQVYREQAINLAVSGYMVTKIEQQRAF